MKFLTLILALSLTCYVYGQTPSDTSDLDRLVLGIDSVLNDRNIPAVGFAIVKGDSILWANSLGVRNIVSQEAANENTLFRIGSISKMFVSLSILKLVEEGKLSLSDEVKDLAPEIEFVNPWEDTNPIQIAHLLEHTTGWDDLHLPEYGHNEEKPVTLKEGLDFHPHSRTSRWVPGTRSSYCNSGPPVAAYIVEKITGQNFESYVKENFFDPIGMKSATYFKDADYDQQGVTLYQGKEPQPYWHIIMRPSGAINANPVDMANFIRFFVNDASADSNRLLSSLSLTRMETPRTTAAARAGVETGYALSNYTSYQNEFLFHGHNGGVNGGVANLSYNRDLKVGYAVMINSGNGAGLNEISNKIARYLTKDFKKPKTQLKTVATNRFDGIYYAVNPRQQMTYFIERLFSFKRITSDDSLVYFADYPFGTPSEFKPVVDTLALGSVGKVSLAVAKDPLIGEVITTGQRVYAPITSFHILFRWVFAGIWFCAAFVAGIWGLITLLRSIAGKVSDKEVPLLQVGPAVIGFSIMLFLVLIGSASENPFELLAKPTLHSVTIYLSTLTLPAAAILSSAYALYAFRNVKKNFIYWFFSVFSYMSMIVALYLWYFDSIGLKTWG